MNQFDCKIFIFNQKSLVGVIILREEVEEDIALNTAALFPPWGRLKQQHPSQWYLFHEPCRWLPPRLEPLFHYAASVRAIFRATDYTNKTLNLKGLIVLQLI